MDKTNPLRQIQRSAWLGIFFLVLLTLIDRPVTILGWCFSLGIAMILVYIILQVSVILRSQKS